MKKQINQLLLALVLGIMVTACNQDQDVAGIVTPENNAVATVTALTTASELNEGDTLMYEITLSKPVINDIQFDVAISDGSVGGSDDFEVTGTLLPAYATSTMVYAVLLEDGLAETAEDLSVAVSAEGDLSWNFLLNMDQSNTLTQSVKVMDFDYSLDWHYATAIYSGDGETYDMCGFGVDMDMYLAGDVTNWNGATGDCPERATFAGQDEGTYTITVDLYDAGAALIGSVTEDFEIPYVATISNNSGDVYTYEGMFTVAENGGSQEIGTLTVDASGNHSVTFN